MYQALYRKYRPQDFDEVIGQNIIIETLKNSVINNKISHAYLFSGPRGTGKTSIAKILANTVNCLSLEKANICKKCVNCTQIKNKQFTDIIEIDAASNNGVDEIREIRNKVNLVPATGKYKVYIIDEVHMLTTGAFNALLKTLEEPPSHAIFILATTEPHKIPITILSRCQKFDFKKITNNQIYERLKYIALEENINIEDDALFAISELSDGGMRDSINLLDQVISYKNGNITADDVYKVNGSLSDDMKIEFIQYMLENNIVEILKLIDKFNEDGKNLIKVLEEITMTLKNIVLFKISSTYIKNTISNYKKYNDVVNDIKVDVIIDIINKFNNNLNNIKTANDTKLAIELLMIKEFYKENININSNIEKEAKKENSKIAEKINETSKENKNEEIKEITKEKIETSKENDILEFIKKVKNRRIENTLANFNKKEFKLIESELSKIEEYIYDEKYAKIISLLMDGKLKAASTEYLLFVYDTEGSSNNFNHEILKIEKTLNDIIKKEYKVISLDNENWEKVKKEFNNKEKQYIYEKENFDFKILENKKKTNELNEKFQDLIEYE